MTTLYARAAGGNWSAAATWSLTSGGGATGTVPTSADDVIFDASSGSVTIDGTSGSPSICRDITCTGYTGTLTQGSGATLNIFGSVVLGSTMTYSPNNAATCNFLSTSTGKTINTGTKALPQCVFNGAGGGWTLAAAMSARSINILQGAFATSNFDVTTTSFFSASGNLTRSVTLGSSVLTVQATCDFSDTTNLTWSAGTSEFATGTINGWVLNGGGLTFYDVTDCISVTGSNTFHDFITGKHSGGGRGTVTFAADQTFTGILQMSGYSSGQDNRIWLRSNAPAVRRTLTAASVSFNKVDIDGIIGAGAANWDLSAITNLSGTTGNNSGIIFTSPMTMYWVHDSNTSINVATAANWFTTSGGTTPAGRFPLLQDTAIFDAGSFPTSGKTVTFLNGRNFGYMDWTGVTNGPTMQRSGTTEHYGDWILDPNMTLTGTGNAIFRNYLGATLTFNSLTPPAFGLQLNAGAGSLQVGDTATLGALTVTAGSINFGSNFTFSTTVNISGGSITNSSPDILTSSGSWNVTGGLINIYGCSVGGSTFDMTSAASDVTIGGGGFAGVAGGGTTLQQRVAGSSFVCAGSVTTNTISLSNGDMTLNGPVTVGSFSSNVSNVRSLTLNNDPVTLTGTGTVWNFATTTNLSFNAATSTIILSNTSASTKTFAGGGLTYYNLQINGFASAATASITGANTFEELDFQPLCNVRLPASTTTTVNTPMTWLGSSGNLVRVESSSGSNVATIAVPSGVVSCDYINITRLAASVSIPFYAGANSTNGGSNTNWVFTAPPNPAYEEDIFLGLEGGYAPAGSLMYPESMTFGLEGDFTPAVALVLPATLSLGLEGGLDPAANLVRSGTMSLGLSNGYTPTATRALGAAVNLGLEGAVTDIGRLRMENDIALAIEENLTTSETTRLNESVSLGLENDVAASPGFIMNSTFTLAAGVDLGILSNLIYEANVALGLDAEMNMEGGFVFLLDVSLGMSATVTAQSFRAVDSEMLIGLGAGLSFSTLVTVDVSIILAMAAELEMETDASVIIRTFYLKGCASNNPKLTGCA